MQKAPPSGSPPRPAFAAQGYVDGWPEDPREFGSKVKAAMLEAGLSRARVTKQARISETTLRSVLTGQHWATQDTRWGLINAIAALGPQPGKDKTTEAEPAAPDAESA